MSRPNNLSIVCLYLSLYISFLLFGHSFLELAEKKTKKKRPTNKKEIYNDKYKHTRDRLFGLVVQGTWVYAMERWVRGFGEVRGHGSHHGSRNIL